MLTEDTLWLPPLSPRDQKRLAAFRRKKWKWLGLPCKTLGDWRALARGLSIPMVLGLRRLETFCKGVLVQFLYESGLISNAYPVVDLTGADLSNADLSRATLSNANLSGAYLSGATLSGANLSNADLTHAFLFEATVTTAHLSNANLNDANLSYANLTATDLTGAIVIP